MKEVHSSVFVSFGTHNLNYTNLRLRKQKRNKQQKCKGKPITPR
jgi:hypothetical protein